MFCVWGTGIATCAGRVMTIAQGSKNSGLKSAVFDSPFSICPDINKPQRYFVGDYTSIHRCGDDTGITLVAGSGKSGWKDGTGETAQFFCVKGLVPYRQGTKLIACDCGNNRVRSVDLKSREVITIAGDGKGESRDGVGLKASLHQPRNVVFDRAPTAKPDAILYVACYNSIRRFDTETGAVTTLKTSIKINPCAIDCSPTGYLVVSCIDTHSLYSIDPKTGETVRVAGTGEKGFADGVATKAKFAYPKDLEIIDSERCAYVTDTSNHRIRRVDLPIWLFVDPTPTTLVPRTSPETTPDVGASVAAGDGTCSHSTAADFSFAHDSCFRAVKDAVSAPASAGASGGSGGSGREITPSSKTVGLTAPAPASLPVALPVDTKQPPTPVTTTTTTTTTTTATGASSGAAVVVSSVSSPDAYTVSLEQKIVALENRINQLGTIGSLLSWCERQ